MAKERYVDLKSFAFEAERNEWDADFMGKVEFLGAVKLSVSVPASERDSDGNPAARTPEDCMARARRRMTLGLMLLADAAMEQLSQEDRDNTVKALQAMKERDQKLAADQREPSQKAAE